MNNRLDWVDVAKGITIILMVLGHTGVGGFPARWIWSFHMPLFFIVSGMFYNPIKYDSINVLLQKIVKTLIIPFVFFFAVGYLCSHIPNLNLKTPSLLKGWGGMAIWFLPVLGLSEILFWGIEKMSKGRTWKIITCLMVCYPIGYIMRLYEVRAPYQVEVMFFATCFYGFGYLVRDRLKSLKPSASITFILFAISFGGSHFCPRLDMCDNFYGIFGVNTVLAIVGTLAIFELSWFLEGSCLYKSKLTKLIGWYGKNTMVILGLSQILYIIINTLFAPISISRIYTFPLRQLIIWLLLSGFILVFHKFAPILIGKNK